MIVFLLFSIDICIFMHTLSYIIRRIYMPQKRLIIEVDEKMHTQIKIRALRLGVTVKNWVTCAVVMKMLIDDEHEERSLKYSKENDGKSTD